MCDYVLNSFHGSIEFATLDAKSKRAVIPGDKHHGLAHSVCVWAMVILDMVFCVPAFSNYFLLLSSRTILYFGWHGTRSNLPVLCLLSRVWGVILKFLCVRGSLSGSTKVLQAHQWLAPGISNILQIMRLYLASLSWAEWLCDCRFIQVVLSETPYRGRDYSIRMQLNCWSCKYFRLRQNKCDYQQPYRCCV